MLFKFLEKPIEITSFVSSNYSFAAEYSPIEKSSNFVPKWWKKTPNLTTHWQDNNKLFTNVNVKACMGIIATFQNGYIVPLWSDLALKINEDETWKYQFSDKKSVIHHHLDNQIPNFYNNFFKFKIVSPWLLQTSEEINLFLLEPFYHHTQKKEYITPYAILPTINKCAALHCFMFLENKPTDFILPRGTPLLHVVPITERKIIFKTEIIDEEKFNVLNQKVSCNVSFQFNGLNLKKIIRSRKNG